MQAYKEQFIDFLVESGVLTFGDFVTKSGRKTPFFVNTGRYRTGVQLERLGRFYADALAAELKLDFDVLFGPAYKGIPLVAATSIALALHHGKDVAFAFNRKEEKDHGEGGVLIGETLKGGQRVVIVEDVTTAGTSIRETVPLLQRAAHVKLAGLIVSVDRMERGTTERSALSEIRATYGMPTFSIVTIEEVMQSLRGRAVGGRVVLDEATYARMLEYRKEYGAA
ncbi:MAG TPA: orotate phosphoribosyltransferase [Polyangiaceae bacterium]